MGFIIDYDSVIGEILRDLTGSAARRENAERDESRVAEAVRDAVRDFLGNIIGNKSEHYGAIRAGTTTRYDKVNGTIDVTISGDLLGRKSLSRRYFGRNAIGNIVNLIVSGYRTSLSTYSAGPDYETGYKRVSGVWRGKRIWSLPVREPYTRYNTVRPVGSIDEHGSRVVTPARRVGSISTWTMLLDQITQIVQEHNLSATIMIGESFETPDEARVRTTLYTSPSPAESGR